MYSLQDLLGPQQGAEAVETISQNVGADQPTVNTAIQTALPALINGLANNASTPQGAERLNNALEQDHDGSLLNDLGGLGSLIFGQQATPPPQANAGGILGHILGGDQGQVAQEVSSQSGLNKGQTAQLLMMLAPIVMAYLGRQKQQQGIDAGGLGGLLGGLLGGQTQSPMSTGQAAGGGSFFDRDGDGSSVDDIASMAFDYLRNRG